MNERSSVVAAQLASPLGSQVLITALHLLGLDFYNNRGASIRDRIAFLKAEYGKTLVARLFRGVVPYFLGAMANKDLRHLFQKLVSASDHRNAQRTSVSVRK